MHSAWGKLSQNVGYIGNTRLKADFVLHALIKRGSYRGINAWAR